LFGMKKIMKISVRITINGHFVYKSGMLSANLLHRSVTVVFFFFFFGVVF
jgi:hypothetical protein